MSSARRILYFLLPFGVLLLAWAVLSGTGRLNAFILPPPESVFRALGQSLVSGELVRDMASSLQRVGIGFLIALVTAVPLGILLGTSPRARVLADPLLKFLRPIPPIAWIPLAIVWFGIGNGPSYFLTMVASFFPILTNTFSGVEGVSRQHMAVAHCFQASKASILTDIVLPSALPMIISGIRTGFGFAWMAVVAAEMIATRSGLGYLIYTSQDMLRTDRVLVGMLAIGLIGFLVDTVIVMARDRWVHWGNQ
ncbi:MAG: ABC transporter permease [Nitrospiraceae bacterium]|nr:ABC transporter permease [Nitrospiraceae bacterium]